jgi:predicted DNA-binding transcriptional regulator AlpA
MKMSAQTALQEIEAIYKKTKSYKEVGEILGIAPAHVWKAINEGYLSKKAIYSLVKAGLIERPQPKDPRPRVWLRTDSEKRAIETLERHYPHLKVVKR